MITTVAEEHLTPAQQDIIDDLWDTFKNTGSNAQERGYMLDQIPPRLHADWNQSALLDREEAPPQRSNPRRSDARSVPRANATTSVDAGIGLMVLAPPVSPPSPSSPPPPGYHPRDESPDPAYRSNEPGTSSSSQQVLAPRAIKTAPPVPVYPWTPKPIGAKATTLQQADPKQATFTFAANDIRLRDPTVTIERRVDNPAPGNSRDRRRPRGNDDEWN